MFGFNSTPIHFSEEQVHCFSKYQNLAQEADECQLPDFILMSQLIT